MSLSDWAFLYTATRGGEGAASKSSTVRFMMSLEDAQKWCSSDMSCGTLYGTPWAYFFTSVENYCNCHWGQLRGCTLDMRKVNDNGKYDDKIKSLGLKKYNKQEMKEILKAYGIDVLI
ncbi:MAG: hypothetical protein LUG85_02775 [Clostridiales bacterium]|nr:hypothetical protein [Clostridiales bacterium]